MYRLTPALFLSLLLSSPAHACYNDTSSSSLEAQFRSSYHLPLPIPQKKPNHFYTLSIISLGTGVALIVCNLIVITHRARS